ncbi:ribonuclease HII [Candidatus Woesearchaeota archaeon]|nr:ribonuclease HII [Candidatus Woesearchaeota archaeon]
MTICGIDEAGRGPVIGPLVMCGVLIQEGEETQLLKLGVKDSKLLSAKQRERICEQLKQKYKYCVVEIPPAEIDSAVNGEGPGNLNWLEADKAAEIINTLQPRQAILDCPSPNIKAYTQYLVQRLKDKSTIMQCAHHADRDFPVVGAASIIAKVTRDARIEEIKKRVGVDFGSGYVADPVTAEFVKSSWSKFPEIFRHSWAPYQKLVKEFTQGRLDAW